MRIALVLLVLLLAGCGGGPDGEATPGVPPSVEVEDLNRPPPAALAWDGRREPLGQSSYCWGSVCADYRRPGCGVEGVPTIEVPQGTEVTFELGFEPAQVGLTRLDVDPDAPPTQLEAAASAPWTVDAEGAIVLFVTAAGGNDASYAACLVSP